MGQGTARCTLPPDARRAARGGAGVAGAGAFTSYHSFRVKGSTTFFLLPLRPFDNFLFLPMAMATTKAPQEGPFFRGLAGGNEVKCFIQSNRLQSSLPALFFVGM